MKNTTNIILDFDSTICKLEGLDELAKVCLRKNKNQEDITVKIEEITTLGMEGKISFNDSLRQRLSLFEPSKEDISSLVDLLKDNISSSFITNIEFIKKYSNQIFVVSGGFVEWIIPVCRNLEIKPKNIFGNRFIFEDEKYVGFDNENLLSQAGGKVKIVKSLNLEGEIIVVGDGFTDYEIANSIPNAKFILFEENVERENLRDKSYLSVRSFDEILNFVEKNN